MTALPRALDRYLAALAARPSSDTVANPYGGPFGEARLRNLRRYLEHVAAIGPRLLLAGEAPGYRGCAITGVPLTSRRLLEADLGCWGLFAPAGFDVRRTLGRHWSETTATVVWRTAIECLPCPPLVANAFPFHPHPPGNPQRNRGLTAAELAEGAVFLRLCLDVQPEAGVIAIGRQAARALRLAGITPLATVRHPSHGGATAFAQGLSAAALSFRR